MAEEEDFLLVEEQGAVLVLTLNRPEKLNAITVGMLARLLDALHQLRDRAELKVMLIRARGRYFCAGVDLRQGAGHQAARSGSELRRDQRLQLHGMHGIYDEMEQIEKPIVVAHHATCLGGGLEMSLSCDFRLAAESAAYGFPEGKFGLLPAANGVSRFTRICGPHWARWLIMANMQVGAREALTMGLVHAVWPDAEFEERAMAFCRHLAEQDGEQMAAAKLSIEMASEVGRDMGRHIERLAHSSLILGQDHAGTMARYVQRIGRRAED